MRHLRSRWLPEVVAASVGLAPLVWFHYGQVLKSIDSFFAVHYSGCSLSLWSAWNATQSAGVPSSSFPSAPLQCGLGLAARVLPLSVVEALTLSLLAALGALGMCRLMREMALQTTAHLYELSWVRWVAAAAGIAWVTNPFSLSYVWFHETLTEVAWAAVPWLLLLSIEAVGRRWTTTRTFAAVGLLTAVAAPGLPEALLPGVIGVWAVLTAASVSLSGRQWRAGLARMAVAATGLLCGLAWWLVPSIPLLTSFVAVATAVGPSSLVQLRYNSRYTSIPHVVTLTAVPQLYARVGVARYIPWAPLVTSLPGRALAALTPVAAALGAVALAARRPARRAAALLGLALLATIFLSKGTAAPLRRSGRLLLKLPFGDLWRNPLDQLGLPLVLLLVLFWGFGLLALSRWRAGRVVAPGLMLVACVVLAVPWWSGSVVVRASGLLPSVWAAVPSGYAVGGKRYEDLPAGGKTEMLPYSATGNRFLAWSSGLHPNDCLLEDWRADRSALCEGVGAARADYVGGRLAAAVARRAPGSFALARLFGVDSWWLDADWNTAIGATGVPPPSDASAFLSNPGNLAPGALLSARRAVLPSRHHVFSLAVKVSGSLRGRAVIARIGSVVLQANAARRPHEAFFALRQQHLRLWLPSGPISRGVWHRIELRLVGRGRSRALRLSVDGVAVRQAFRLVAVAGRPVPRDVPVKREVMPVGRARALTLVPGRHVALSLAARARPSGHGVPYQPRPVLRRADVQLWTQPALPLIYATRNIRCGVPRSTGQWLEAATAVEHVRAPVFAPCGALPDHPAPSLSAARVLARWRARAPSGYDVRLSQAAPSSRPLMVVMLQSCSRSWQLRPDSPGARVLGHTCVDGFANGWIVRARGRSRFSLEYAGQADVSLGALLGAAFALLCLCLLLLPPLWRRRPAGGKRAHARAT